MVVKAIETLEITESLYLEKRPIFKMDSRVPAYRWSCKLCTNRTAWTKPRVSDWSPDAHGIFEGARQHWKSCHPEYAISQSAWSGFFKRLTDFAKAVITYGTAESVDVDTRVIFAQAASPYFGVTEQEKKGMSRLTDIENRLRELEKEAARYARFEKTDPWPVGTVVMYEFVPNGVDEEYTYAVLKAGNSQWYWTGSEVSARRSGHDYDALVECLADDGASNIRVALPADFKPLFPEATEESTTPVAKNTAPEGTGTLIPRLSEK